MATKPDTKTPDTEVLSVRLPTDTMSWLREKAADEERPAGSVVRQAVKEFRQRAEKKK